MKKYLELAKHYEKCFIKHGDNHLGVDWPNHNDAQKRYKVMLDILKFKRYDYDDNVSLLDFGCGTGHLLEFIKKNNYSNIDYDGMDISEKFISHCKKKFKKNNFFSADILNSDFKFKNYEFIIANGVFTEKRKLSQEEMWNFFIKTLEKCFSITNQGIAFNLMSKHVDWERDDLFHVSFDKLASYLTKNISRNFMIRNDYGLYEYSVYLFK